MKLNQLLSEEKSLGAIYLKGVRETDVLKDFKSPASFKLSRGREDEIVEAAVKLINAGHINTSGIWWKIASAAAALRLKGDAAMIYDATSGIEKLAGEFAPASVKELKDAAITMQNLIESNSTLYKGMVRCKQVLDHLAGLSLKIYPRNGGPREVSDEVSFMATMTLKGLGIYDVYKEALADGKRLI